MRTLLAAVLLSFGVAHSTQAAIFVTTLRGAHEVPPNASPGGGGAFLSVDLTTRGWTLTGAISNLVIGATAAHIHGPAPEGQNGPVIFPVGFNFEPEGPLTGDGIFSVEQLGWLADGLLYVNVHTPTFPGGEIRGQLVEVPEPGAFAVIAVLGLCAFAARRRLGKGSGRGQF